MSPRLLLLSAACTALAACAHTPAPQAAATPRIDVPAIAHPSGETPEWWYRYGASQAAERGAMRGKARNVILFVGDGMSLPTVAAARILDGQRRGGSGEENFLGWEHFEHTALSRTYNTNSQTPDSAGTMTAMSTGAKTRMGVVGIGQEAPRGDCAASLKTPLVTLWQFAAEGGMATGVVTTTRLTHATPASALTHSPERNWEADSDMPEEARAAGCRDIAAQIIESPWGNGPTVLMGGGRGNFMPATERDPERDDLVGQRLDGRNLINEWRQRHPDGSYVWNARQFAEAPLDGPLLALFNHDHMEYEHDRPRDIGGEPSLAEMTRNAIARLSRDPDGYVLLVEGGRIDHAHHAGNAFRALTDAIALSEALKAAVDATSAEDTLILVTADHAHTMTFAGYPARGNPILGKVRGRSGEDGDSGAYALDLLGLPYTTLGYANGPGYIGASAQQPEGPKRFQHEASGVQATEGGRPDLTHVDTEHPDFMQEATVPIKSETHGGDDVGIWARGPGAEAIRGSLEQNAIFHVMVQATPRLREIVCKRDLCNADGVPVVLPRPAAFGR